MKTFDSGARSSEEAPRYDLIPLASLKRQAARMAEGAMSHGERNYLKGAHDPVFIRDRINHLLGHALAYAAGDTSDDHLGAILANAGMLADIEAIRDNRAINRAIVARNTATIPPTATRDDEDVLALAETLHQRWASRVQTLFESVKTAPLTDKCGASDMTPRPRPTYDDIRANAGCSCGKLFTHPQDCQTAGRCLALDHPHAT